MTLALRAMRARDVPRGMDLVRMAGWNQTEADWRMMLSMGEGHGVEDETGRLVASSMVLPYAPGVGWIGMVLVDESVRRRGLATTLLRNAIDRIEATGSIAMLDATPAGARCISSSAFAMSAASGAGAAAASLRHSAAPKAAST